MYEVWYHWSVHREILRTPPDSHTNFFRLSDLRDVQDSKKFCELYTIYEIPKNSMSYVRSLDSEKFCELYEVYKIPKNSMGYTRSTRFRKILWTVHNLQDSEKFSELYKSLKNSMSYARSTRFQKIL